MKPLHSPGPWTYEIQNELYLRRVRACAFQVRSSTQELITESVPTKTEGLAVKDFQVRGNAYLIAAAPVLLEASIGMALAATRPGKEVFSALQELQRAIDLAIMGQ